MTQDITTITSRRLSQTVAANVRAEAARAGMINTTIAPNLDMKAGQVGRKMRGVVPFTIDELGILAGLFGHVREDGTPDLTEFFRITQKASLHAAA